MVVVVSIINYEVELNPCHVRDWKKLFDPTVMTMGAFAGFGEQVLHVQKSLKKL